MYGINIEIRRNINYALKLLIVFVYIFDLMYFQVVNLVNFVVRMETAFTVQGGVQGKGAMDTRIARMEVMNTGVQEGNTVSIIITLSQNIRV